MTSNAINHRENAIALAKRYFDEDQFKSDLGALVAFETESQKPERKPELLRYLSEAIQPRLSASGFTCKIFNNDDPHGGPFLVGERIEDVNLPTVLTYGHGDVIRAQTSQWRDGLQPFKLIEENGRYYGRGTADNKGQHLINIIAIESILAKQGSLGFNAKVVIETSEETGSAGLGAFFEAEKERLKADVLIASDGPRLQPETPTIFLGSRGGLGFDLVVKLRDGAHHSGNWGGLLADPAMILAHALATICDRRGQIKVPEWRPDSLTERVRAVLKGLPVEDPQSSDGPQIDTDWGEENLSPAERAFGWNSFAVLAMTSGVPDAPVNAISPNARATCQLRFVVGTDPSEILPALRRHLDLHGYEMVKIKPHDDSLFKATRLEPDHPWVTFTEKSLSETTGKNVHVLPNLAGSLPNDCFTDILGLPTIWVPHSYRGCSQHAPDEHIRKDICREALQIMAGLFWDIGNTKTPTIEPLLR